MSRQKFAYPKTDSQSGSKRMDIINVINLGGKAVRKRLEKRGIKIPDITHVRMHAHQKIEVETKKVITESQKFHIRLKTGEEKIVNLSRTL